MASNDQPGGAHPMESKKALAREMVARFHGPRPQ